MTRTQHQMGQGTDRGEPGTPTTRDAGQVTWWTRALEAFASPLGFFALLLVAVQSLWRGTALAEGHYNQGDYLLPLEADEATLGWAYLTGEHVNAFSPVGRLLAWVTVNTGGVGWGAVVVVVLLLQALAALLLWVVLTQILEQRWVRIPLLAVGLFSPLTLGSTFSWSQATTYFPVVVFLLLGLSALLSHLRDGWDAGPLLAGVAFTGMLLSSDRALLLPLVVFAVVAATLPLGEVGIGRRVVETLTRYLPLWGYVVVFAVARTLLAASLGSGGFVWPASGDDAVDVVQAYVRQGLTGLVGGPWVGEVRHGVLTPEASWPMAVGVVACVVFAVPLLRAVRHSAALVAVLALGVHFVLGGVFLVTTRQGFDAYSAIPLHLADVVVVAVVLVAVSLRVARVPERVSPVVSRFPGATALVVLVIFLVSTTMTTRAVVPSLQNEQDRAWFAEISKGLQTDPRIVLMDATTPEEILHPWYEDRARLSYVARFLPQQPAFDVPSEHLRIVDMLGILRTFSVEGVTSDPGEAPECGHLVEAGQSRITFPDPTPQGRVVMEVAYFTNADNYLLMTVGDQQVRMPVQSGLHNVRVPVEGGFDGIEVRLEAVGAPVCVGDVTVGHPVLDPVASVQ